MIKWTYYMNPFKMYTSRQKSSMPLDIRVVVTLGVGTGKEEAQGGCLGSW